MKSSLPAKLHRIRTFGALKLEEFQPLISKEDYLTCVNAKSKLQTWYPLTIDVFISFLYKVWLHPLVISSRLLFQFHACR